MKAETVQVWLDRYAGPRVSAMAPPREATVHKAVKFALSFVSAV